MSSLAIIKRKKQISETIAANSAKTLQEVFKVSVNPIIHNNEGACVIDFTGVKDAANLVNNLVTSLTSAGFNAHAGQFFDKSKLSVLVDENGKSNSVALFLPHKWPKHWQYTVNNVVGVRNVLDKLPAVTLNN